MIRVGYPLWNVASIYKITSRGWGWNLKSKLKKIARNKKRGIKLQFVVVRKLFAYVHFPSSITCRGFLYQCSKKCLLCYTLWLVSSSNTFSFQSKSCSTLESSWKISKCKYSLTPTVNHFSFYNLHVITQIVMWLQVSKCNFSKYMLVISGQKIIWNWRLKSVKKFLRL